MFQEMVLDSKLQFMQLYLVQVLLHLDILAKEFKWLILLQEQLRSTKLLLLMK